MLGLYFLDDTKTYTFRAKVLRFEQISLVLQDLEVLIDGRFIQIDNYSLLNTTSNINFMAYNSLCNKVSYDTIIEFNSKIDYIEIENEFEQGYFVGYAIQDIGKGYMNKHKWQNYIFGVFNLMNDIYNNHELRALAEPSKLKVIEYPLGILGVA